MRIRLEARAYRQTIQCAHGYLYDFDAFEAEDDEIPEPELRPDEMGDLAITLRRSLIGLVHSEQELRDLNASLEGTIAERTAAAQAAAGCGVRAQATAIVF